jgi:hypothetical protein
MNTLNIDTEDYLFDGMKNSTPLKAVVWTDNHCIHQAKHTTHRPEIVPVTKVMSRFLNSILCSDFHFSASTANILANTALYPIAEIPEHRSVLFA